MTIALALLVTAGCGSSSKPAPPATTTTTTTSRNTTTTASTPSTAPTTTGAPTTTTTATARRYVPLFPFGSLQEVAAWQRADGPVHQPWRIDAGQSALAFARFLGYGEVNRLVRVSNDATGAHVAIGFDTTEGRLGTAAIVHLIRYGSGTGVPWEVVGTDDTDFTVDSPAYGSTVTSPVRVGGRITGVDESISVRVQQLHANGYLGERVGLPAGGENTPWSTTVTFGRPTDPVVIIHASTGGHIQQVERFAVTGVRVG